MPRKQLTVKEKRDIVRLRNIENKSYGYIAKEYDRDKKTIHYVVKMFDETENLKRRIKLCSKEKRNIIDLIKRKPSYTIVKVKSKLSLKVANNTIYRYLHKHGYHYGKSKKAPYWVKQ